MLFQTAKIIFLALIFFVFNQAQERILPDGREFPLWEKPLKFSKTYYVDGNLESASDNNPGTKKLPFKTISKAAKVLLPGERAIISEGIYREKIQPARGGLSADKMISYQAAEGA